VWGQWDCCLYPAAWIESVLGLDPAAEWRGAYDSEEGAQAFLEAGGGVRGVMGRAAASVGLQRSRFPAAGAVGVVRSPAGPMGAICVSPGLWSTVAIGGGVTVTACPFVVAWEIGTWPLPSPI